MREKRASTEEAVERKKARIRAYNARPEVKARKRAYASKPEVVAARKAYYRRPEVLARYKERSGTEAHREYCKQWRQTPSGKQKLKASGLRQSSFTEELRSTLLEAQGFACAVCGRPFTSEKNIHADHCHETGVPRGLLCNLCNVAEGLIKKTGLSPREFGERLRNYLEATPCSSLNQTSGSPVKEF